MEYSNRKYSIDLLKVIATVFIIFHHYQQVLEFRLGGINFFGGVFNFSLMVELFFLISGMLSHKYIELIKETTVSFEKFFVKKLIRFVPVVSISVLVMTGLEVLYRLLIGNWRWDCIPSIWGIVSNSICIWTGWYNTGYGINNPMWYISVLLLCYLFFYFLTKGAAKKHLNEFYIYIFLILLSMGITTYSINIPFLNYYSARGLAPFFFGLLIPKIQDFIKDNIIIRKALILELLVV